MHFQPAQVRGIAEEVKSSKDRFIELLDGNKVAQPSDVQRVEYFIYTLRVFEVEFLAQLKEWDRISQLVGVRI